MKKHNAKKVNPTISLKPKFKKMEDLTDEEVMKEVSEGITSLLEKYIPLDFKTSYLDLDSDVKLLCSKYDKYITYSGFDSDLGVWGDVRFYISLKSVIKEEVINGSFSK